MRRHLNRLTSHPQSVRVEAMKLLSILTVSAIAALSLPTTASASAATVTGEARCEADGSWSVNWTVTAPSHGGLWSILPGMYQDPRPWQPDTVPFTFATDGHGDQADATVGITYGWQDGPTGQWATGTVSNPGCREAVPVVEPIVEAGGEPVVVEAAGAMTATPGVAWLSDVELRLGNLRSAR